MSAEERANRSDYPVFRTLTTRWMDNDIYGHMNNVVHYSLFDTAVNGWLIKQGLLDLSNSATVFLVVETGCKYYSAMAFPDIVTAGIRITKLGNSSIKYQVGLSETKKKRPLPRASSFMSTWIGRAIGPRP